jgi:hypothetical protein
MLLITASEEGTMRLSASLLQFPAGVLLWLLMGLCGCTCAMAHATVANPQAAAEDPDVELKNFELGRLQGQLRSMPPGAERDYFAGVLANRQGRTAESIRLLEKAEPAIRDTKPARAAIALRALAYDLTDTFQYREAAGAFDDLLEHFAAESDQGDRDDAGVVRVLRNAPPQTIEWRGPVRLKIKRDPIASWVAQLDANGVSGPWLLDTGANMSVVSRSFAARLGLKPLPGTAQTQSSTTGIENPLRIALVPSIRVGRATLHNVVVLVMDDASLKVGYGKYGKRKYQIDALLGYPALQALGAITFYQDGWFEAGATAGANTPGARMYLDLLTPVIECGVEGAELPFSLDTGAEGTNLSVRYYQRFRGQSRSWKKGENISSGAGGMVKRKIFIQPKLELTVGGSTATLAHVPILTEGDGFHALYGNLGEDLAKGFASFTIDFNRMTFRFGPALDEPSR